MKYVEMREALRDKNQMEAEDAHLKYLQDLERGARYEGMEEGLSKGRAEGLSKGRVEGRVEGRTEGRAEGRIEGEVIGLEKGEAIGRTAEKENVVINSRKAGLSVEAISTITELTIEQIIEILKRHGLV